MTKKLHGQFDSKYGLGRIALGASFISVVVTFHVILLLNGTWKSIGVVRALDRKTVNAVESHTLGSSAVTHFRL